MSATSLAAAPSESARTRGTAPAPPERPPVDTTILRWLLWFYLALWITEGALRKWIFPGMATPLLIVRDPFLLIMYAIAMQKGVFPRSAFIPWIAGVSLLAVAFSMVGSSAPLVVQAYGFRADFMHLPLIFLIPNIFDRDDLIRVGRWVLLVALPMSFLVLLQFKAPPGARVNVGVGGEGTMLDAGFGHIRASGTFSFTNGLTDFTAMVAAFCLYGVLRPKAYPLWLRLSSFCTVTALVMLSASRGVVGMVIIVLSTVIIISLMQPRYLAAAGKIIGVCGLGAAAVGSFAVFRDGMEVFAYRFGSATNIREGFVGRFFLSFTAPFDLIDRVPFYGVGLGMGTNVGSGLLYEGARKFLYAESELGRVMFESGPVIGPVFILLRFAITGFLFIEALKSLRRDGHPLPMLLFGACAAESMLGPFGQATTLGFVTIACGLCLAANRPGKVVAEAEPVVEASRQPVAFGRAAHHYGAAAAATAPAVPVAEPIASDAPPAPAAAGAPARGRSTYAEQMRRELGEEARRQKSPGVGPSSDDKPPA